MIFKDFFLKPNNQLEGSQQEQTDTEKMVACSRCGNAIAVNIIRASYFVCPNCGHYFTMRARRRIMMLTDRRSFVEHDAGLQSENILGFPEYEMKLQTAQEKSQEKDAVVCGRATISGYPCCIFVMEAKFMMGSMGAVVGEKITRLFEYAAENHLPVIGATVSGGARMQEGMVSLMQMSKVSAAVKRHSDQGNLYIVLLTSPTTGGVNASFAMQGDIILSEPRAIVGFAGPRVVEQTLKQKLPENFQRAEEVLKCGFIDAIVPRKEQKEYLANLLSLHGGEKVEGV